jgi:hypothetical protein
MKVTTIESTAKPEKVTTKKDVEVKEKEEANEVVYLKSNPKKQETKTTTTTTTTTTKATTTDSKAAPVKAVRGLTAEEVREANEIFN